MTTISYCISNHLLVSADEREQKQNTISGRAVSRHQYWWQRMAI